MPDFLNIDRALYHGVGKYNMPIVYGVDNLPTATDWIGFNYVKTTKKNPSDVGVHFYLKDEQFERVWNFPDRYGEMLKKYNCVIAPDFSVYINFPRAVQIYNKYRQNWLSAYWHEEFGINVIPNVTWGYEDSYEWCFDGMPKHSVVAVSNVGCMKDKDLIEMFNKGYNEMLNRLEPKEILFYTYKFGNYDGNVHYIKFNLSKQEQGGK